MVATAVKLGLALVVTAVLALGFAAAAPTRAFAAGDQIDSFAIRYSLKTNGVLSVEETITYRFGDSSGRHGIERYLVTREPYDQTQDAVYDISNLQVTSRDGVSTEVSKTTIESRKGREQQLRLRIGNAGEEIAAPTATYVISYDVAGAMRTSGSYDELYWDATGLDWKASIRSVRITATVPGGAKELTCTYGAAQSASPCTKNIVGGAGQFSQTSLGAGQGVTIGVKIQPGLVTDNSPHLERDASAISSSEKVLIGAVGFVTLALSILSPISEGSGGVGTAVTSATRGFRRARCHYRGSPPRLFPTTPTSRSRWPSRHLRFPSLRPVC